MKTKYLEENLLESIVDKIKAEAEDFCIFSKDSFISPVKNRNSELLISYIHKNLNRTLSLCNSPTFELAEDFIVDDLEKVSKITEVLWLLLWYSNFPSAIEKIKKNGKKDEIFDSLNKVMVEFSTVTRIQDLCLIILCNFVDIGLIKPGRLALVKDQKTTIQTDTDISPMNKGRLILSKSRVILRLSTVNGLVSRFLLNHPNFWKSIIDYMIPDESKCCLFEKSSLEIIRLICYSLSILNGTDPTFWNKLK